MAFTNSKEVIYSESSLAENYNETGFSLLQQGQLDVAVEYLTVASQLQPDNHQTAFRLGLCYQKKRNFSFAIQAFEKALALCPDYAEAFSALGIVLQCVGNLERAMFCYEQAIALNPNGAESYTNLGTILKSLGRYTEAIVYYEKSLAINDTMPETYSNLGSTLLVQSCFQESVIAYRRALLIRPDFPECHSNLLFALNYNPEVSAETLFAEHQDWAKQRIEIVTEDTHCANTLDCEKRLKIGYVSPDLCTHSVAYFLEPLLTHHDHQTIEIVCYAEVDQPDQTTERLKKLANSWHFTCGLSDEQVALQIQQDKVDILVDLAGHTGNNRLGIFARKPAPVQITYLGYPGTTGLSQIDYRLTDAWADQPGQEAFHSEMLVRLETGFLCYLPQESAPEVAQPPYFEQKVITFGSFNSLQKINERVIVLWSRILHAVPNSRLLLKSPPLEDLGIRERYYTLFEQHEIVRERLIFYGYLQDDKKHLQLYSNIDIALDPFPYNGTTTTCEALWMGVPVITLAGQSHRSRVGVSILSQLNLQEFITTSESEYVKCAVNLAKNTEQLMDFRSGIRFWMAASSLCDGATFTRQLEDTYRQLWKEKCEEMRSSL